MYPSSRNLLVALSALLLTPLTAAIPADTLAHITPPPSLPTNNMLLSERGYQPNVITIVKTVCDECETPVYVTTTYCPPTSYWYPKETTTYWRPSSEPECDECEHTGWQPQVTEPPPCESCAEATQNIYDGTYCSTIYAKGPGLPTTRQGSCGTILILNASQNAAAILGVGGAISIAGMVTFGALLHLMFTYGLVR